MVKLSDPSLLRQEAYVAGEWTAGSGGSRFDVFNPATGDKICDVPDMTAKDAVRAIEAADAAWSEWRATPARKRSALLRAWFDLIKANAKDLAAIMTAEQGKPAKEAFGEVLHGAAYVEWFAEEAKRIEGDVLAPQNGRRREFVLKQPVGVVAAITPWNFPSAMITRKIAPALAAGCTVVIKPAEDTPLSALALAELAHRAGFPTGVINVLPASHGAEVGGEFARNPTVRKLSFTGSTQVGKLLMSQCSDTLKKLSLELGGNAPFIVFDDADLKTAVASAMGIKFINAGQTCICANRMLVQDGIHDAFVEHLSKAVDGLNMGPGADPETNIGPLINSKALDKVEGLVADAVDKGASVARGGKRHELGQTFFQPTVLTGVEPAMNVFSNEIFGPVAGVHRFSDEEEAIRLANDTPYGLAAYFFTRDMGRTWRVGEALEYGMVGANEVSFTSEVMPFGGVKESGFGREGSKYGIDEYLEIKYLCVGGL